MSKSIIITVADVAEYISTRFGINFSYQQARMFCVANEKELNITRMYKHGPMAITKSRLETWITNNHWTPPNMPLAEGYSTAHQIADKYNVPIHKVWYAIRCKYVKAWKHGKTYTVEDKSADNYFRPLEVDDMF